MRLRLWQRLFLAFGALSALVLLGFLVWQELSFRHGFTGYLNETWLARMGEASQRLAERYRVEGSWDFLARERGLFRQLIDPESAGRRRPRPEGPWSAEGGPEPRPPPPFGPPERPPGEARPPPPGDYSPNPARDDSPPPPPRGPRDFDPDRRPPFPADPPERQPHVMLVDAAGAFVAGNRDVAVTAPEVPVLVDGQRVGTLRLQPIVRAFGGVEEAFAAAQWRNGLVSMGLALAIALLLAFALARRLLAPVRALVDGARALGAGEYERRLTVGASDELGVLALEFNHLAERLEAHRAERRQWTADIAHELRTPISVLRSEIQALEDGVRQITPQALGSLHAECDRLAALVEDLYQLSLADAGALEYRYESVDLSELAAEAIERHAPKFEAAGIALTGQLGAEAIVSGDERRLIQLIDNLLGNSLRYTDAPGRVVLAVGVEGGAVRLTIDDTAPSVPNTALPRLFDRLFRVERSRSRAAGGAGLGLAICRAIVQAHHGGITASRSPLGGLRVDATFALDSAPNA